MTCPHWLGKCGHIGEAFHRNNISNASSQDPTTWATTRFVSPPMPSITSFPFRRRSVGLRLWPVLARISDLQTGTSVWTSCMHHLKRSRCGQSSGALLSGFWLFWLGSSWQRACHVPYHHWRWQRIQWWYYQFMHTHIEHSDLWLVPVSQWHWCSFQWSRPEPQHCSRSLFSFYLWSILPACIE